MTQRPFVAIGIAAIACAAISTATPVWVQSRSPGADRQALTTLEHEWLTAVDSATLNRILARDFVHPVPAGRFLTKAEHIKWFVGHPDSPGATRRFTDLDVRLYGEVGVVNGMVVAEDTSGGEAARTVFTDVFVYRDGRWQAINGQENAVWPAGSAGGSPEAAVSPDTEDVTAAGVTRFLREYYQGFAREDSSRLSGGVTRDFDSYFAIPSHGPGLLKYGAADLAASFGNVVRLYHGHHPEMHLSDVVVVVRADSSAVASYRMRFSLDGRLRNDALAVSELRWEGGGWKIYRHFEAKRR